jgi:hypothetical protein
MKHSNVIVIRVLKNKSLITLFKKVYFTNLSPVKTIISFKSKTKNIWVKYISKYIAADPNPVTAFLSLNEIDYIY